MKMPHELIAYTCPDCPQKCDAKRSTDLLFALPPTNKSQYIELNMESIHRHGTTLHVREVVAGTKELSRIQEIQDLYPVRGVVSE